MPAWFHTLGGLFTYAAELVAPFFVFGPRRARHIAGGVLVLFQLILISSGNLAFLNLLTLVTTLICFDDSLWGRLAPSRLADACSRAMGVATASPAQRITVGLLFLVICVLSIAPGAESALEPPGDEHLLRPPAPGEHLRTLRGITRERYEIVLLGTTDPEPDESSWREYHWKCKPGDPQQRPCFVTPYHYRLDWLIWFAAMSGPERHPWVVHLMWKLLHNDPGALSLLAENPFPDEPPRFVRADLYLYEFTEPGAPGDTWWKRTWRRRYVDPSRATPSL